MKSHSLSRGWKSRRRKHSNKLADNTRSYSDSEDKKHVWDISKPSTPPSDSGLNMLSNRYDAICLRQAPTIHEEPALFVEYVDSFSVGNIKESPKFLAIETSKKEHRDSKRGHRLSQSFDQFNFDHESMPPKSIALPQSPNPSVLRSNWIASTESTHIQSNSATKALHTSTNNRQSKSASEIEYSHQSMSNLTVSPQSTYHPSLRSAPIDTMRLKFRCHVGEDCRVLIVSSDITIMQLRKDISEKFKISCSLKYKDQDGFMVSFSNSFSRLCWIVTMS
jgi:hypothetical protein